MITLDFDLAHYLHLRGYARAAGLDRDQDRWRDHVLGLSAARRRAASPKFNVLTPAPMTAGSGYSFTESTADRTFRGRIVESVVGLHLFNTASSDIQLHYWRQAALAVDFVLQRGPRLIAMEGKSRLARRGGPKSGATTAMEAFSQRFRIHRSLLVKEDGVPLIDFPTVPTGYWVEAA